MRKNRMVRFWTLSLALILMITTIIQYQAVYAKGVTKKWLSFVPDRKRRYS